MTTYDAYGGDKNLLAVDRNLGIYELTDLFYSYYAYHDHDCAIGYEEYERYTRGELTSKPKTLPRLDILRRLEGAYLGTRPFIGGAGITPTRPNISMGYFGKYVDELSLPYKTLLTDSDLVRVRVNKNLYDTLKLSPKDQEELQLAAKQNPLLAQNKEVGDDISDAYADILRMSKKFRTCKDELPRRLNQDGVVGLVHSDFDWAPDLIHAVDLITEPQAKWDSEYWTSFFVIRKMPAQEAISYITGRGDGSRFWNKDALRWALNESMQNSGSDYRRNDTFHRDIDGNNICGENYMVKSYYYDKSARRTNIGSYYGNMMVVECYYMNTDGKVNKAIIFPSRYFANVSPEERASREEAIAAGKTDAGTESIKGADVLFFRQNVFDSMREAITVIPADRSEPLLERQRSKGMKIFAPLEIASRLDSSIQNFAILMGVPFTKNRTQGTDAQNLEDLEINLNGDMVDLGERDFVEVPFSADLNSMLAVRNVLLQHTASLVSLGGLDGNEMMGKGLTAQLSNLRLIKDGRMHKQDTEAFAEGFSELLRVMFRRILDLYKKPTIEDNVLLQRNFFDVLTKVQGHPEELFEFESKDIVPDTLLPYWINIEMIRNGGSSFGTAELVLYSEIKNIFGDGLDQRSLQALNRMGIKSVLGQQDAIDILGDPKEMVMTDQDQLKSALEETTMILGSVSTSLVNYEQIPISPAKDDHVLHLTQAHLPKLQQMLEMIQQNEVAPSQLEQLSEDDIDSRIDLILKSAALSNHVSQHADMLARFGSKRKDINRLKEETNVMLQSVEGLLNNMQLMIRARQAKRQEREAILRGMSPESQADQQKLQIEMMEIQRKTARDQGDLALANKIADYKREENLDQRASKRADRELQRAKLTADVRQRDQEAANKRDIEAAKLASQNKQKISGRGEKEE